MTIQELAERWKNNKLQYEIILRNFPSVVKDYD